MVQKVAVQFTMLVYWLLRTVIALCLCSSLSVLAVSDTSPQSEQAETNITAWLLAADNALKQHYLLTPKGYSAYDYYRQVLAVDGSHPQAHWGMREIGRQYLRLAEEALIAGDRRQGYQLMSKALSVSASIESVAALKAKYPVKSSALNAFAVNGEDLERQNDAVKQQLAGLAVKAQSIPSRLLIIARSDAEGRWMYKIMREAVSGYRLRGNIALGDAPKIVLIDADASNF